MPTGRLGESTQEIANTYPPWSAIRQDEQSLGYQLLNIPGVWLDDLNKQLYHQGLNHFLGLADTNEIDILYSFRLARSFEFANLSDEDGVVTLRAPAVSATIGSTDYTVTGVDPNNIEEFWYRSVPTRISVAETNALSNTVLAASAISSSPFALSVTVGPIPTHLWVNLSGGTVYLDTISGIPIRGVVTIRGTTRRGAEREVEHIVFLHDGWKTTQREWLEVTDVEVTGITPETATVTVLSIPFARGPYPDFYSMEKWPDTKETKRVFWGVEEFTPASSSTELPVLNKVIYQQHSALDRIGAHMPETEVERRAELRDATGVRLSGVLDLAIFPFRDWIWVLDDSSRLHLYDRYQYYPDLSGLTLKEYDSDIKIESLSNHAVIDETIEVDYIHARPIKEILRHRVYLQRPDNTLALIAADGTLSTFTAGGGWVFGGPIGRDIRTPSFIVLTQRGDWVFTLEVEYTDRTRNTDQRIVTAESKTALASFSIPSLVGGETATGIGFDSDGRLWARTSTGNNRRILPAYDYMLVDFDEKVLYFKEQYDIVRANP